MKRTPEQQAALDQWKGRTGKGQALPEPKGGVGTDMDKTRRRLEDLPTCVLRINGTTIYEGNDLKAWATVFETQILPQWESGDISRVFEAVVAVHTMKK